MLLRPAEWHCYISSTTNIYLLDMHVFYTVVPSFIMNLKSCTFVSNFNRIKFLNVIILGLMAGVTGHQGMFTPLIGT